MSQTPVQISLEDCRKLDADDELRAFRDEFRLPADVIYLDGNSLGALPVQTADRVVDLIELEWGRDLIRSWEANGWIGAPSRIGDKIARLVGAHVGEVIATDSTSANLFKLIVAALQARPGRQVVLSEPGNFPTDLYMIQGALAALSGGHRLELRPRDRLAEAIDHDTALVLLTHVHYKTADVFDMPEITSRAHAAGALMLWDLSHSVGAVAVDLNAARADLAVGCGYKYLNGGPGAPAFLFVAERHHQDLTSPLTGWMGHASPFDFSDAYQPAPGVRRFLCGTPSVMGLAALETGVDLLLRADMGAIAAKSAALCRLLTTLVEQECGAYGLEAIGPALGQPRGSHVSFRHPDGYAIMRALIARGVIGDFRGPDVLRFGLTPLYLGFEDVWRAVQTLRAVLADRLWDAPEYRVRTLVT
ncbi:kynureninase [Phenylobacterium sp.]|uniref:kynureninase n=1 Tax=Phenylobacterium sp. TaxID=1871053 RepID=UPI002FCA15A0